VKRSHAQGWTLGLAAGLAIGGSCGLGSVGIVSSASDGGGSTVTVQPTTLDVATPGESVSGEVALSLDLQVDPRRKVRVERIEYSLRGSGGPFHRATPLAGFPNEVDAGQELAGSELAERGGDPLRFVWNAAHDLVERQDSAIDRIAFPITAAAVVRVELLDLSTGTQVTAQTGEFVLDERLVRTLAGGGVGDGMDPGQVCLHAPSALATDPEGRLLIADTRNHRLRRLDFGPIGQPLSVRTLVGNGFLGLESGARPARATGASFPGSVAVDVRGNVYLGEVERDERGVALRGIVRRLDAATGLVTPVVDGRLLARAFREPLGLALGPTGTLWAATGDEVWVIDVRVTPVQDSAITPFSGFARATDLAALREGAFESVYVVDAGLLRVQRLRGAARETVVGGGTLVPTPAAIGARGDALRLFEPTGVATTERHLFVCDRGAPGVLPAVVVLEKPSAPNPFGAFVVVNVLQDAELLRMPAGLAVDGAGKLFIVEEGDGSVETGATGHVVLAVVRPEIPSSSADAMVGEDSMRSESQGLEGTSMEQQSGSVTREPPT
jgi:sugar lactone lactonase YvrE